ncbi:MAG TPA: hypothetical protein VIX81_09555 [Gammaproteobacteria bacterium]
MRKPLLTVAMLACTALPAAVLACAAAGPNAHVGTVSAVDPQQGTLTLRDAESGAPMTFNAPSAVLESLAGVKGPVRIQYQQKDGVAEVTAVDR